MGIDRTEELLKKYDYNFQRENKELIIKMDFALRMIIDFSDSEKIIIKDKLVGWNPLTGLMGMSIKGAILYNIIGAIIITFLLVYLDFEPERINLVFLFLAFIFWVLLWTMYYLMKSEYLKQTLISWNEYKPE